MNHEPKTAWQVPITQLRAHQARVLADILLSVDPQALEQQHTYIATAAGDERKLRGIPAIGRSVAGAIPGTSPHSLRNIR